LDIPPPRPPATFPVKMLWVMMEVPLDCVFRPPPLIGAELPAMMPPLSVSWPEFIMPPPPTPVVVLSVNWAPTMLAVPLAALSSPPPLPALLPDRSTWVKAQDARVPDAAAQAGGAPVPDGDAGQAEAPARGDVQDAKAVAAAWLRLITVYSLPVRLIAEVMTGSPSPAAAGVVLA
jgi:hypothetical protein